MKNLSTLKNKIFKTALGLTVALSTLASSAMPAFAADVELQGNGSAKSQSVEVSAEVNSLYAVTLPAVIELTRQAATLEHEDMSFESNGFWYEFNIGAAGKLLSNHTLKAIFQTDKDRVTGTTTNKSVDLACIGLSYFGDSISTWSFKDFFVSHAQANKTAGFLPIWTSDTIGSCDYDGASLTNCEYVYKKVWVGVPAENIDTADTYEGTITVEFTLE